MAKKSGKNIIKEQTRLKNERVELIAELILEGLTTSRAINSYMKESVKKDPNSVYDFKVHPNTLTNYIKAAKSIVVSTTKVDYHLLSSFVNKELMETVLKAKSIGDEKTKLEALDRMSKLNGLFDMELMKILKYSDVLKEDVEDDKNLETLSEKEIREKRKARKEANEKRKI